MERNQMKERTGLHIILPAMLSGLLMSVPYLVPHCGIFALFALTPLLWAEHLAAESGMKRFWIWHYLSFVLWNTLTTFWVCNATLGGGIFAILANSLQMSVIFGLFRLARKKFSGILPYLFIAFAWIAWEKWYLDSAQISWPWLVLGNAFARSTSLVQWYEYTGTLGGSLWVWASNISIFMILKSMASGSWKTLSTRMKVSAQTATIAILVVPAVISMLIYHNYKESDSPLEVAILQPNIDPYHKFEFLTQRQQDSILVGQIRKARDNFGGNTNEGKILLLAPETFTSGMDAAHPQGSQTWQTLANEIERWPQSSLIFGASTHEFIASNRRPSKTSRHLRDNLWYESHNSAVIINPAARNASHLEYGTGQMPAPETELYHKSKLVVGVEMTPYPTIFVKLDDMLGGVMGRCVGQEKRSCLNMSTPHGEKVPIGSIICYESIYGDFCRGYIESGAQLLAVITNDAWWKDTPGYRQHLSYSCLRAIETRRDIVRCANTGVSAIIDQRGNILSQTPWWQKKILHGHANLNDGMTFFVLHGDIVGRISTLCFLLMLAALLVKKRN